MQERREYSWSEQEGLLLISGQHFLAEQQPKQQYARIVALRDPHALPEARTPPWCATVTYTRRTRESMETHAYLQAMDGKSCRVWFLPADFVRLDDPGLEAFRLSLLADTLQRMAELDGFSLEWLRQSTLYTYGRDTAHALPSPYETFSTGRALPSCLSIMGSLVHAHVYSTSSASGGKGTPLRFGSAEELKRAYRHSADRLFAAYASMVQERVRTVKQIRSAFRSGRPRPQALVRQLGVQCVHFDWTEMASQDLIARLVLQDPVTQAYPPEGHRVGLFLKALVGVIEWNDREVHEELLSRSLLSSRCPRDAFSACTSPSFAYNTLEFGEGEEQMVTLKMSDDLGNNDGMTGWPAGYLCAEFVLHHRHWFEGKRVLELGAGIGLTAMIVGLVGRPDSIMVTDYDQAVINNLTENFLINGFKVTLLCSAV